MAKVYGQFQVDPNHFFSQPIIFIWVTTIYSKVNGTVVLWYYKSYELAIFEILHAIEPWGCSEVVQIFITYYSRKVIRISAIATERKF